MLRPRRCTSEDGKEISQDGNCDFCSHLGTERTHGRCDREPESESVQEDLRSWMILDLRFAQGLDDLTLLRLACG